METSTNLITRPQSSAYRRIVEGLRGQISTGKYTPGTRLPSTKELAVAWRSSPFTIHTALRTLAKEGWIDRRHGAGTYIADPKTRFLCAGIYYGADIGSNSTTAFVRNLHFSLMGQLERLKKKAHVIIDSRPEIMQEEILPELEEAIANRRIQCLIVPVTNFENAPFLARLVLPTVFTTNPQSPHEVGFDTNHFFQESMRLLAAQGCRSVGLISNVWLTGHSRDAFKNYYKDFRDHAAAAGLTTRDEWIRQPLELVTDLEAHGYHEFKKLARLDEKPDGLIVAPDDVVRGVILAVLELGLHVAPTTMKFVFHRNAHVRFLCPFPVTWGISDEDVLAEAMVQMLQQQFDGEKISRRLLPYTFKQSDEP